MEKLKKLILILFLLGAVIYIGCLILARCGGSRVQAEEVSRDNLQFCVDAGKIYFFQPETGRIFVYQGTTNRFSRLLTLERLGEDLKQSRSLSTLELPSY